MLTVPKSVKIKLQRVDDLLLELDDFIKTFLRNEPYSARRVVEDAGLTHKLVWEQYVEPPAKIGLIAGDAIHNLRSSLDHLVVALAQEGSRASGVTMTLKEERRLQFPIVSSFVEWERQMSGNRLLYVDEAARVIIESNQPFRVKPANPKLAHLLTLSELDDADKHRFPVRTDLVPGIVKVNWPASLQDMRLINPYPPMEPAEGAELGRFTFDSPRHEDEVPIDFQWGFTMWVGYWTYFDVRFMIENYVRIVQYIVRQLMNVLIDVQKGSSDSPP